VDDLPAEVANLAVQSGIPFLKSGANGEVYACNTSFCELMGYSEYEIKRKGWIELSVKNDDLEADQSTLLGMVSGHLQTYTVIKSYVGKNGTPIPGQLFAIRYPEGREPMQFALCWFVPLANGSKAALTLVIDYIEKHTNATHEVAERIATMASDLQLKKAQTIGQRLWDTIGEWALGNPKIASVTFLILLSLNPFPIVMTWFTRMGWMPPQPVQLEVKDPATGELKHATPDQVGMVLRVLRSNG
jgi:PAS domain S-box-containing protein